MRLALSVACKALSDANWMDGSLSQNNFNATFGVANHMYSILSMFATLKLAISVKPLERVKRWNHGRRDPFLKEGVNETSFCTPAQSWSLVLDDVLCRK